VLGGGQPSSRGGVARYGAAPLDGGAAPRGWAWPARRWGSAKAGTKLGNEMATQEHALLEVEGLARSFGETRALVAANLSGQPGTVHSILGENGSGKSTMVKILSGVLTPDRGRVVLDGQEVAKFTPATARSLGVATVFQDLLNVPVRSVLDNVLLGHPGWLRYPARRRERAELARAQLARLGLVNLNLDIPVGFLPLPAQQLVAIARALTWQPRVLVLDEATSALDVGAAERLFGVLREELRRGALVLFISHRMDEIVDLADAVTVLANGVSVQSLSRAEISVERLLEVLTSAGVTARG
jgi:ribose transport system ATP-binding protein